MRKSKKLLVSLLIVTVLTVSMASVAFAAPAPTTNTTNYGYGVITTDTTFSFDTKYEALIFIESFSQSNYQQAVDYLTGFGISSLTAAAGFPGLGTAFSLVVLAVNMGQGAMIDNAKAELNKKTTQHVTVTVNHTENPRAGGFDYMSTFLSVGTW